jgi:hypothetical protein
VKTRSGAAHFFIGNFLEIIHRRVTHKRQAMPAVGRFLAGLGRQKREFERELAELVRQGIPISC